MDKHAGSFFWGVLLGAVTTAIVGSVIISRSFRSSGAGIDSWADLPPAKGKPAAHRAKTGKQRRVAARN